MRRFVVWTLFFVCLNALGQVALADDPYWDKGRSQSTMLAGTDVGRSTFVISAQAFYLRSGGWGRERLRVWGRNESVRVG